jgi:hypothetical protein
MAPPYVGDDDDEEEEDRDDIVCPPPPPARSHHSKGPKPVASETASSEKGPSTLDVVKAQKYAKEAVASLQFNDLGTAIERLKKALALLIPE